MEGKSLDGGKTLDGGKSLDGERALMGKIARLREGARLRVVALIEMSFLAMVLTTVRVHWGPLAVEPSNLRMHYRSLVMKSTTWIWHQSPCAAVFEPDL